ncbi:serine hydrolase domain-containing protein [Planobispora takensis]|uniref:Serine hydrolase n=1 Tax=Planobispora takensis TaxID=1367882 RepID=A0A8J3STQ6_9ACTN|nr:serine hydrolase domain-containing protein [Planobispora takensis]GIH98811.1 serine hydrolase [Planobispora takensis]
MGNRFTARIPAAAPAVVAAAVALAACSPGGGYGRDELQRDLNGVRNAGAIGVQALVTAEDGEPIHAVSGVADLETRETVPLDGRFRIASDTKPFVAAVVLQLAGEGRLSLDDAVERHLPGVVRGHGHDGRAITIRHLLGHTSGIYDHSVDPEWNPFATRKTFDERRFDHYEPEELVAVAMRHPPAFAPGTAYAYSNTNYVLAGMIIRKVTGNPWRAEVRDRVIEPLGLTRTTLGEDWRMPSPHARGYHQFEPGGPLVDATLLDPSAGDAGGALISTPRDLTRFFRALLGGGLLAPELLVQMKDTVPEGDGRYGLGLGWSPLSCGGGYWRHGGAVPGYLSAEGFTEDGSRGVVVSVSTFRADGPRAFAQEAAVTELIDNALCA